jgi:hypothetical protein
MAAVDLRLTANGLSHVADSSGVRAVDRVSSDYLGYQIRTGRLNAKKHEKPSGRVLYRIVPSDFKDWWEVWWKDAYSI